MATASLSRLIEGFSRQGRDLLQRSPLAPLLGGARTGTTRPEQMEMLARALLSTRGEASGVALASDLLAMYAEALPTEKLAFFQILASRFGPDGEAVSRAFARYRAEGDRALGALAVAVEAPRQELFRRLNLAPRGTAALVALRADLLAAMDSHRATLGAVDADLCHLLLSWFNRGFLEMRAIGWSSPGSLLERVIRYEAVHDIHDWEELRRRLSPPDRRCYGFFHPSLPDEPLIFVEVALTGGLSPSIGAILAPERKVIVAEDANTAIFYSISNCQPGLKGISFGHFLIKQVAADIKRDLPNIETFATLSPLPGFRRWLEQTGEDAALLEAIGRADWQDSEADGGLRDAVMARVVAYFTEAKTSAGKPVDSVARFHLGNGAQLERANWLADLSTKGVRQSAGVMVNYLYDLRRIEERHEAYTDHGTIATGEPFRRMAIRLAKTKTTTGKPG